MDFPSTADSYVQITSGPPFTSHKANILNYVRVLNVEVEI